MLLGKLSHIAKANIEATNRGEKIPEVSEKRIDKPYKGKAAPMQGRQGPIDPTTLKEIPDGFFTGIVSAQDSVPQAKRKNTGYTHVSDLIRGFCARQVRFSDEKNEKIFESPTGGHRVMWLIGRAVEKHIRDSYIKGVKGKGVLGKWICKCTKTEYEGFYDAKAKPCPFCRTSPSEFNELAFFDHEAGVVGNPDLPIVVGNEGDFIVVEIKSMNPEDFDDLVTPLPDHIYQAASYRRLLLKADKKVSNKVLIVYCTKKFKFGKPYKEFMVDVTSAPIQAVLDNMWAAARELRELRKNDEMPCRIACANPSSPMAKKCPHVTDCFMRG